MVGGGIREYLPRATIPLYSLAKFAHSNQAINKTTSVCRLALHQRNGSGMGPAALSDADLRPIVGVMGGRRGALAIKIVGERERATARGDQTRYTVIARAKDGHR